MFRVASFAAAFFAVRIKFSALLVAVKCAETAALALRATAALVATIVGVSSTSTATETANGESVTSAEVIVKVALPDWVMVPTITAVSTWATPLVGAPAFVNAPAKAGISTWLPLPRDRAELFQQLDPPRW